MFSTNNNFIINMLVINSPLSSTFNLHFYFMKMNLGPFNICSLPAVMMLSFVSRGCRKSITRERGSLLEFSALTGLVPGEAYAASPAPGSPQVPLSLLGFYSRVSY